MSSASEAEVAAGGGGEDFGGSDVALAEYVEVAVTGLGGDALKGTLAVAVAWTACREWEVIRFESIPEARPRSRMITPMVCGESPVGWAWPW